MRYRGRSSRLIAAALLGLCLAAAAAPVRAADYTPSAARFDPYKNFKFRVKWDGRYVAGISKVSPLIRRTEVIEHRSGGDPSTSHKSPGRTGFDAVTLERGVSNDTAFEDWANQTWSYGAGLGAEVSPNYRKDIIIELMNDAGQLVQAYHLYACWVSDYQALPELNANASGVALQALTLQCDGWERDKAVVPPG